MDEFQKYIRDKVRNAITGQFMGAMLGEHTTSRGNITHDWLLMQLAASKVADLDDEHKNLIRRHIDIPHTIFHDRISVIDWEGLNMRSSYYAINTVASDLGWIPEIAPVLKGKLWDKNTIELQAQAGIIGGELPGIMTPSKSMIRWHEVVRWSREQMKSLNQYNIFRALGGANLSVKQHIFILFVYHTVRVFENPENRTNDAKWNMFHHTDGNGPITWEEFAKKLPDRATSVISEMARDFQNIDHVYVWDTDENSIKLARSADTDPITDAPEYGLDSGIYDTKRALQMPQDTNVFDSSLSSITIMTGSVAAQQQTEEVTLSPEFSSDVLEYTGTVANLITHITLEAEPTHEYAAVDFNEREDLEVGENIIELVATSQDGQSKTRYTITITRS